MLLEPQTTSNAALEFHDSELCAIEIESDRLALRFAPAYVHRSDGVPGVDPGTGWTQNVTMQLVRFQLSGTVRLGLASLADGEISLGGEGPADLVAVPLSYVGPVSLRLVFLDDSRLEIVAEELQCVPTSEATYFEEFPGAA
jgi:hypothetical protein